MNNYATYSSFFMSASQPENVVTRILNSRFQFLSLCSVLIVIRTEPKDICHRLNSILEFRLKEITHFSEWHEGDVLFGMCTVTLFIREVPMSY